MPIISRFYGVRIRIFYNDHPPPHFHAVYGEYELIIGIEPILILAGRAPNRVQSMVIEWTALHQVKLSENWKRCQSGEQPVSIDPLE